MFQSNKFILIFSTQRSGSTMVTSDFTQTKALGNPKEYFTEKILPASKFNNCCLSQKEIETEIKRILSNATTPNSVTSIKVMSDYVTEIAKALEKIGVKTKEKKLKDGSVEYSRKEHLQNIFVDFFNGLDIDNDFLAFRVYRKDKVKQAVSQLVAGKTGLYHVWKNDKGQLQNHYDRPANTATPFALDIDRHYNYDELNLIIDSIYQQERDLDDFFINFNISPINLIYEDIVHDTSYLKDVVRNIGNIDASDAIQNISRKTVKTSSKINDEIIRRFNSDGGYKGKANYALSK